MRKFPVKGSTNVPALSGSILYALEAKDSVVLMAIGAGAVNQAMKAVNVASKVWNKNTGNAYLAVAPDMRTSSKDAMSALYLFITIIEGTHPGEPNEDNATHQA
jgi:stage V sporulation protein SpoVS